MPKLVYIAHPMKGDIKKNFEIVMNLCNDLHTKELVPVVPYMAFIQYANRNLTEEGEDKIRELGIIANREFFERKVIWTKIKGLKIRFQI